MKRFEYKVLEVAATGWAGPKVDTEKLAPELNSLGRQGWELLESGHDPTALSKPKLMLIMKMALD